jgi:hypothetical protein
MAVQSSVSLVTVEPVDAYFGAQHLVCVDTVDASALDGKYFNISSLTADYYVWFDGGGLDPAPAGRTAIAVTIVGTESAIAVAALIESAVNAVEATNLIHSRALSNQAKVLIEVKGLGAPNSAYADVDSTMVMTIVRAGSLLDFGLLDGDVEFGLSESLFDIVAHQTGPELRGQLRLATEIGPISLTLKETTVAKLKEVIEATAGQAYTPAGGTEVSGIGALSGSKQFSNVFSDTRQLVLHPTKNDADDYSGDFNFWASYPNLSNLVSSGESDRKMTVDCAIYLDENRENAVSKMVYGDWTQNYLKA